VERARPFPFGGRPLSWAALAEAQATGLVTLGSHTHGHVLLDRVAPSVVANELDRSIAVMQDRLGLTPDHFAYPKALGATGAAEAEVRRRFRSAALAGGGTNRYGATDVWRLARTPIQVSDGMTWFRRKASGGMALEGTVRRMLNRRYAGATT
jgi:peptidoglycan/xylan/chitin deacetylase (PgdA/CDA1 family)